MKVNDLRKKYLEFFQQRGHKFFSSDSLVPDDPTVLFTSAGMNQFKPYFLGKKKDCSRAVSCQKCLRTGDLDQVGQTPFHHTFFEMLGNFSFGEYFKKEAIEFAWEFLTGCLNIKEKDLWISVYKDDEQAYSIWKDHIGVSPQKIVHLGEDSNFWPASAPTKGPNGPCGPCTEIFFDKGAKIGCGKEDCDPSCDCGRFVEIWNLVFTQFNRVGKNKLEPLPQKNIDTGMGLERMASVLQEKDSNFQIDILQPVCARAQDMLEIKKMTPETESLVNAIVDHVRAAAFSIVDGVFPSNEERGYVVRKLIRRALSKAALLKCKKPFLHKLVPLYAKIMNEPYPELENKKDNVSRIIFSEEEKFLSALKEGKTQFGIIADKVKKEKKDTIKAEDIFRLYDTHGLPLNATANMAADVNLKIDKDGFFILLEQQQQRSRKKSMFEGDIFQKGNILFNVKTQFLGYDSCDMQANIVKIIKDGKEVKILKEGEEGFIIIDKTPFYPESGGQLYDTGLIKGSDGEFFVSAVSKENEVILHKGKVTKGSLKTGEVKACIDKRRRKSLMRAHTAAHLLQSALRRVLGDHVSQQGSFVGEDVLRFDFTHFQGLNSEQIHGVEKVVNDWISRGENVIKKEVTFQQAEQEGALAFFKDKYKEKVRMVSVSDYSKELCGGTHVDNTSEIGSFFLISESSISSGVRRIEAVVGREAYKLSLKWREEIKGLQTICKAKHGDLLPSVKRLVIDFKKEKERADSLEKETISSRINDITKSMKTVNGIQIFIYDFSGKDSDMLRYIADFIKEKVSSAFIFLTSSLENKNIFLCASTKELIEKGFSAKKFISDYKDELLLKGGGKDSLVQGVVVGKSKELLIETEKCFKKFVR